MPAPDILVIEDNLDDEELTLRAFRKNNISSRVIVLRDGAAAMHYFFGGGGRATRDMPQVVLLDLNLPKVSGLDILRALREDESTRHLPVVILTSSMEEQDMETGYRFGANSYIRKPVNFDEFVELAEKLGHWLLLDQLTDGLYRGPGGPGA